MIDPGLESLNWHNIGFGGVAVLGFAVVLAAAGMSWYTGAEKSIGVRRALAMPVIRVAVSLGLASFWLGVAGLAPSGAGTVAAGVMAVACAVRGIVNARHRLPADDQQH